MAQFCGNCGAPLGEGRFCAKCGAPTGEAVPPAPKATPASPSPASPTATGLSGMTKLGIAAVVIIFVGGGVAVAGMFYAAHRVSEKFQQVKDSITGTSNGTDSTNSKSSSDSNRSSGNPCRYLSTQDVATAIGVEIVGTKVDGESCSYLAKGTASQMATKHASAIMKAKGVDEKSQKMFEQLGGALFNSMPQEKNDGASNASGSVPVLGLSVSDSANAIAEMKLNAGVLKNLGGPTGEDLDLGDQAFVSSDGMIMIRKGRKIIRIMYVSCPCGTKEIVPLAKQLVASL